MSDDIKAKLAKLLRLQESSNAHEAANAASLLERLCRQHGISPEDVTTAHDAAPEAVYFQIGDSFSRVDYADALLLEAVTGYFNGDVVVTREYQSYFRVFATTGNRLQIELYFDYLREVADRMATTAKRSGGPGTSARSFRLNFRKGFAIEIGRRLAAMRAAQQRDGDPETGTPGLVLADRATAERAAVSALVAATCKNLRSGRRTTIGSGGAAGRAAASDVGLNKQMSTARPLALTGS